MAGTDIFAAAHAAPKVLASQQMPDTTEDTVYTAPATGSAVLKHGTVCNTSGSAVTISLSVLKAGATPGSGQHRIVSGYSLAAGDTLPLGTFLCGCCLGPSDFVTLTAGAANVVDVVLSGIEYS